MIAKRLYITLFLIIGVFFSVESIAQENAPEPIIPNVFSPNGDGTNDTFKIINFIGSWELMIFDRWGSLIYATQQAEGAAWNGVNLQGIEVDEGVYFYTLKNQSSEQKYSGSLHLFR
jgi:gliding motility-associated-like protein